METYNKQIVSEIASELGVKVDLVESVLKHNAAYTAKCIRELKEIRWPYFGAFKIIQHRLKKQDETRRLNKDSSS